MPLLHPLKPRRTGAPIKTLEKANSYQFNSLLTIGRMLVVPAESLTILYRLQISLSSDRLFKLVASCVTSLYVCYRG